MRGTTRDPAPSDDAPPHPDLRGAARRPVRRLLTVTAVAAAAALTLAGCGTTESADAGSTSGSGEQITLTDGTGDRDHARRPGDQGRRHRVERRRGPRRPRRRTRRRRRREGLQRVGLGRAADQRADRHRHPRRTEPRHGRLARARPHRRDRRPERRRRRAAAGDRSRAAGRLGRRLAPDRAQHGQPRPHRQGDRHRGRGDRGEEGLQPMPSRRASRPWPTPVSRARTSPSPTATSTPARSASAPTPRARSIADVTEESGLTNAWTVKGDEAYGLATTDVEGLTQLPADVQFLYIDNTADGADDPFAVSLASNAVWKSLPFVQSGDVHRLRRRHLDVRWPRRDDGLRRLAGVDPDEVTDTVSTTVTPTEPAPSRLDSPPPGPTAGARAARARRRGSPPPVGSRSGRWACGRLVAVVVVLALVDVTQGTADVGPDEVWQALTGTATAGDASVVVASRLPRMVAGLLVGVALGAAGAALQAVSRNVLASPDTLAVNAGAYVALAIAAVTGLGPAAARLVRRRVRRRAARRGGSCSPLSGLGSGTVRLVLAGSALALGLASVTSALLLLFPQRDRRALRLGPGQHRAERLRRVVPARPGDRRRPAGARLDDPPAWTPSRSGTTRPAASASTCAPPASSTVVASPCCSRPPRSPSPGRSASSASAPPRSSACCGGPCPTVRRVLVFLPARRASPAPPSCSRPTCCCAPWSVRETVGRRSRPAS